MINIKHAMADRIASVKLQEKGKICPFQSSAGSPVLCGGDCQLYRADKRGYECPLQELPAISFSLKPLRGR